MRISSVTLYHGGGVTLWYQGEDIQSDYFPAMHDISQRHALEALVSDGVTPSCYVEACNGRSPGEETPETKSGRRFALRAGLPFRDSVRFPIRATAEEARRDTAIEPDAVVIWVGENYRDDGTSGPSYRGVSIHEVRGRQVIGKGE